MLLFLILYIFVLTIIFNITLIFWIYYTLNVHISSLYTYIFILTLLLLENSTKNTVSFFK